MRSKQNCLAQGVQSTPEERVSDERVGGDSGGRQVDDVTGQRRLKEERVLNISRYL